MSFKNAEIGFAGLNVLVGPNGAGKTNLLKLFRFLGETARTDLVPALEAFGGINNILFAGERSSDQIKILIEATITKHSHGAAPDSYELKFRQRKLGRPTSSLSYIDRNEKFVFKRVMGPGRRITLKGGNISVTNDRASQSRANADDDLKIKVQPQSAGLSTLRRLGKDVEASQVDELASLFESIRVFDVGVSGARLPSGGEMSSRLSNDARNIAAYLAWLKTNHDEIYEICVDDLKQVVPGLSAIHVELRGDAYYIELEELGLRKRTSLPQASFGTIRSIALFAMLHDPSPPKLTCVEEIDHGLHPYALDVLVDRMRAAALRTQLVVATHSPALVNRLRPEELIVFERDQSTGETRIPKIDPAALSEMEQSSGLQLGELWFSGTLGGVP